MLHIQDVFKKINWIKGSNLSNYLPIGKLTVTEFVNFLITWCFELSSQIVHATRFYVYTFKNNTELKTLNKNNLILLKISFFVFWYFLKWNFDFYSYELNRNSQQAIVEKLFKENIFNSSKFNFESTYLFRNEIT